MGSITIDGVSEGLAQRLRTRAKAKGHTLEQAALEILNGALPGSDKAAPDSPGSGKEMVAQIRAIYGAIGWLDDVEWPTRCRCQCQGQCRE